MSPACASSRKTARSPATSSLRKLGPEPCPEGLALLFAGRAAFLAENAANPASRQPDPASGLGCEAQMTEPHLHARACQRPGAARWFSGAGSGPRVPGRWWCSEPHQRRWLGAERSDHTPGGEWTDAVCPRKAARSEACAKAHGFGRKSRHEKGRHERNNACSGWNPCRTPRPCLRQSVSSRSQACGRRGGPDSGGEALAFGRQFACREVEGSPLAVFPARGSVRGAPLTRQEVLAKLLVGDC
jgi:hypothetical protein